MTVVLRRRSLKRVSPLAIEIYGGYGLTKDYPVEKYWRDAKIVGDHCQVVMYERQVNRLLT